MGGLVRAAHPMPSAAVTVFAAGLGVTAGLAAERTALLAAAVLTGQLSIGWCNDAVDADRDTRAGRTAKPVAAGDVGARTVAVAAGVAAATSVVLSLLLGLLPGALHVLAVASAWAYDLVLKATLLSPLPYLVSFALLPAIAVTAAGGVPRVPVVVAAGVVGVGAHLANTVPDAAADEATGVRGLPQRLGPRASRVLAGVAVLTGCTVVLAGGGATGTAAVLLGAAVVVAAVGVLLPAPTAAFRAVVLAALLTVAGLLAAGPAVLVAAP